MDDMEVKMKKALKERELMEQQLNDTVKKLNFAKNVNAEKSDLEDQVSTVQLWILSNHFCFRMQHGLSVHKIEIWCVS